MEIYHKKFYWNPSMRKKGNFYYWLCNSVLFYVVNPFIRKQLAHGGVSKLFWNSFMLKAFFGKSFLLHRKGDFCIKCKFSNKNQILCAWSDFNKTFCGISTYHKWMFEQQISSIFNFDWAHQSWISVVLGVKYLLI